VIDFNKAKKLTEELENAVGYGTEDFSIFLYSLIKMRKPNNILELGTGVGSTMLWSALACKENGFGKVTTIDNGLHWVEDIQHYDNDLFKNKKYYDFINNIINDYDINDYVVFKNENISIESFNNIDFKIDILFSDFDHGPDTIQNIVISCLDKVSDESIIFIDSASTYYPSYLFLESLVNKLNSNGLVDSLSLNDKAEEFVSKSKFSLVHLIEDKDRSQNSTAMIEIKPKSEFPNSKFIRF
jgi:predicted O-methyltransferase YrrM